MYEEKEENGRWYWRRGGDWKEFTHIEYVNKIHELSREIRRLRRVIESIGNEGKKM